MRGVDVVVPVDEQEAIWIGLVSRRLELSCAVRLALERATLVDAITGHRWTAQLSADPQNYVVVPPQRSLDGVYAAPGLARQFVRVRQSAAVVECRRFRLVAIAPARPGPLGATSRQDDASHPLATLARQDDEHEGRPPEGGLVIQAIVRDPFGLSQWDADTGVSVTCALVSYGAYRRLARAEPPEPRSRSDAFGGWRLP